jgi:hypothetical protein
MAGFTGVRGNEAVVLLLDGTADGKMFGERLVADGDPGDAQGRRCRNEGDEKRCAQSLWLKGRPARDGHGHVLVSEQDSIAGAGPQQVFARNLEGD